MYKKLAKYGNSTALVIDKAILELLNINESSIVKLRTDGNSLIITPAESAENNKVSYDASEALEIVRRSALGKVSKIDQVNIEEYEKMQSEFKKVFQKHMNVAHLHKMRDVYSNPEFIEAVRTINVDPETSPEIFQEEVNKKIVELYPEYETLLNEVKEVANKYKQKEV